jgi:diguanylate cyclase (GGDEF)-like protein
LNNRNPTLLIAPLFLLELEIFWYLSLNKGANFKTTLLSFRRKPESSVFAIFWTPAFAGVTVFDSFEIGSKVIFFLRSYHKEDAMKNQDINIQGIQAFEACMEVGKLLTSSLDLKEILKLIVLKVSQLIQAENWSLLLKDEETGELTFDIVVGMEEKLITDIRLSPGEGIAGHVLETGEPVILQNVQDDKNFFRRVDEITGFHTRSVICVPLKTQGKILGVMEIINVKDTSDFQSRYLPILMALSDYAAIAIQNSHHCDRVRRLSVIDEYTGLYNARFLYQYLENRIENDPDHKKQFAVIFVDIDNFKKIVDTYGHISGSQVLKEVGQTMSSCTGKKDILVKYGGDEYVLIFPENNRQQAIASVEKILDRIRETPYLVGETTPVHLTASFGIAMYPEDAVTPKDILIKADQILYSVKRSTKNGYGAAG